MPDLTVLIVEDHDILREGLQILLESEGYRVIPAAHGGEALKQMEYLTPDLILSDISMPEMDGYAFYDAVRSRPEWVAIPFIFLTALGDRDSVFASKRLGVEDYLVKPVDRQELVTTIRSRLERSQQLMLAQLQQAYESSLIMLANAIELRDKYTRGHVERVMRYALLVAERLGWTDAQLRSLRFGAILHDIGKIYIRESILSKPGLLTDEEWAEMKQHTVIGADLIRNIPFLSGAIPIIRHHHERWDGKGYPDGLAGEDIPLGARIVAVVDCFDAMTTDRVYHESSTAQEAIQEIIDGRGTRYDPAVVDAFLSIYS
ncbi:MAG: response regulator [Anaerolineales bacterium]|jgi:putative two-component system response regulator|nr:response regulator [Anaerolineales bacterium]